MKKLFIAPLLLSAMVCGVPSVHADTMDWMKGAAGDTLKFFGEAAEGFVSGMAREARSSHWCMDHEQAVINKLLEQGVAQDDVRISMAKGRYDACKAAADGFDQAGNKVASGFGDAFTFVMNQGQAEIEANRAK